MRKLKITSKNFLLISLNYWCTLMQDISQWKIALQLQHRIIIDCIFDLHFFFGQFICNSFFHEHSSRRQTDLWYVGKVWKCYLFLIFFCSDYLFSQYLTVVLCQRNVEFFLNTLPCGQLNLNFLLVINFSILISIWKYLLKVVKSFLWFWCWMSLYSQLSSIKSLSDTCSSSVLF